MRRYKRKTDRGVSDFDALLIAIKEIKLNKKSIRSTAMKYNIPKSSLARYIRKINAEIHDISLFDDDELMKVVRRAAAYNAEMNVSCLF